MFWFDYIVPVFTEALIEEGMPLETTHENPCPEAGMFMRSLKKKSLVAFERCQQDVQAIICVEKEQQLLSKRAFDDAMRNLFVRCNEVGVRELSIRLCQEMPIMPTMPTMPTMPIKWPWQTFYSYFGGGGKSGDLGVHPQISLGRPWQIFYSHFGLRGGPKSGDLGVHPQISLGRSTITTITTTATTQRPQRPQCPQ